MGQLFLSIIFFVGFFGGPYQNSRTSIRGVLHYPLQKFLPKTVWRPSNQEATVVDLEHALGMKGDRRSTHFNIFNSRQSVDT